MDGGEIVVNVDGEEAYKTPRITRVARIGETEYITLAEAFAAAKSGDTIELIAEEVEFGGKIPANVTITGNGVDKTTLKFNIKSSVPIPDGVTFKDMTFDIDASQATSRFTAFSVSAANANFENLEVNLVSNKPSVSFFQISGRSPEGVISFKNVNMPNDNGMVFKALVIYGTSTVKFDECEIDATYPFNCDGSNCDVLVTDSKLHGWTSWNNGDNHIISFTNTAFSKGNSGYNNVAAYKDTEFKNCTFSSDFVVYAQISSVPSFDFTFENCTKGGEDVYRETFMEQFPNDPDVWNKCDTYVNGKLVGAVAEITSGETTTEYKTLQAAVDAAHKMTGDVTVKLTANITETPIVHQKAGLNLTIDGNGKTITGQIYVDGDGRYDDADTLTIQNVKFAYDAETYDDAFVCVPSTKTAGKPYATDKYNYAHNITVKDCEFAGEGITTVAVRVASSAGAHGVTLSGNTVNGGHSFAQLTGVKDLTITDNTVTGVKNGINISGGEGTAAITGNKLTANETEGYTVRIKDSSGMSATLAGNVFSGGEGIVSQSKSDSTITITDGKYAGPLTTGNSGKILISGGLFTVAPALSMCADGLFPISNPDESTKADYPYTVGEAVAQVGDAYFGTLVEAVAAAKTGDTVTLLKDVSGAGIFIAAADAKDITVDLNNHTYTVSGPAVGSTGTATQAFHLEKGNTVAIKNGTVTSTANSGVKMLVQNYCDLTLTNVTLDGTNLLDSAPYTLSNNAGAVTIGEGTTITAKDGGVAFDVCTTNYYPEGTQVTIANGATINGNIELGVWDAAPADNKATLTINGGSINGNIVDAANGAIAKEDVVINAGIFKANPAEEVNATYPLANYPVKNADGKYEIKPSFESPDIEVTAKLTAEDEAATKFTYTGEQIKPVVVVKIAGENKLSEYNLPLANAATAIAADNELKLGEDYTVTYGKNVNAGKAAGTITITGTGATDTLFGNTSTTRTFDIENAEITQVTTPELTFNNETQTPELTVKAGDIELAADDYEATITPTEVKNAGEYIVNVKAAEGSNFKGSAHATLTVAPKNIADADVTIENFEDNKSFQGVNNGVKQNVTITFGNYTLDPMKDYTVEYQENASVGTATIIIKGTGNFTGQVEKTFTITGITLSDADVTVDPKTYVYDGTAKTPTVTVKKTINGAEQTLTAGDDYTVSYFDNVNAGEAAIFIIGEGGFSGGKVVKFEITKAKVNVPTGTDATYDGTEKTGIVADTATPARYELTGTTAATEPGLYFAVASLNSDNYQWADGTEGAKAVQWKITSAEAKITIAEIADQMYTGSAVEPEVTVTTDPEGVAYDVTYSNNVEPGTATVTVTAKGGYTGEATANFKIVEAVATTGGKNFATLAEAIAAAENDATVTLLANVTENVTVPADKSITLDLAGNDITGAGASTIINNGTLTITDSADEDGTITTTSGNYVIQNFGTMTIEGGRVAKDESLVGAMIENGWYTPSQNTTGAIASLTINGGTFEGGWYNVKNDDYGELTVTGGTFVNGAEANILAIGDTTVTGGDFTANGNASAFGDYRSGVKADAILEVSGGTFHYEPSKYGAYYNYSDDAPQVAMSVTGGAWSDDTMNSIATVDVPEGQYLAKSEDNLYRLVDKTKIEIPKVAEGLTYNAAEQTGVAKGEGYALTGNAKATNAGDYTTTATLTDAKGTMWADGTTEAKQITWTIAKADLAAAKITAPASVTYNAAAQEPELGAVKLGDATLAKDTDFTVAYTNNTNAGTATVTITGKGNYQGTAEASFTIVPATITEATIENQLCTGSALTPTPVVKAGELTVPADGYTVVSYLNNTKLGEAAAVITGTGNFTGMAIAKFNIVESDKAALEAALEAANAARVATSDAQGFDLESGAKYVTSAEQNALTQAVEAAQAVYDNPAATADEIAEATNALKDATAAYETVKNTAQAAVAKIGDTFYTSLAKAVRTAQDGDTVTLLTDTEEKFRVPNVDETITIDLGGKTLTGWLGIDDGPKVTIKNGTLNGSIDVYAGANDEAGRNALTIAADATVDNDGSFGIVLREAYGTNGPAGYGSNITIDGTVNGIVWVMGNISGQGTNPSTITVNDGAKITGNDVGIALNGVAKVTVNGGTITGVSETGTGIEVRAGELTVNGGTITGEGTSTTVSPAGSGTTTSGAGIAIAQHTTKQPITVTVNGGTIKGATAVYESDPQGNGDDESVKAELKGGTFIATNGSAVQTADKNVKIPADSTAAFSDNDAETMVAVPEGKTLIQGEDGLFRLDDATLTVTFDSDGGTTVESQAVTYGETATEPEAPTRADAIFAGWADADGKAYDFSAPVKNDIMLTAQWTTAVAKVGDTLFASLQAAVDAAEAGDTVTMIADEDLAAQVVVDRDVTIDLNGKTLSNTSDIWDTKTDSWSLISVRGGNVTITGEGTLRAKENDCYALDVRDGGTLTIEDGTYVGNIHAVYVHTGDAFIEGGDFSVQQKYNATTPDGFVINLLDANRDNGTATATITGGTFHGFDPSNNPAEGAGTDFTPEGLTGHTEDNSVWTVAKQTKLVSISAIDAQTYTGSAITPKFTVTDEYGKTVDAENYTFDFADNTNPGVATLTVKAVDHGAYYGEVAAQFVIADGALDLAIDEIADVTYKGEAWKPEVKVDGELIDTELYDVAYLNNVNAGTATVVVTAKDANVKGTATQTFTIKKADIASTDIIAPNKVYTGDAKTIYAVMFNTHTLKAGTDYAIVYLNNVNAGTATAILAGKGNFEGLTKVEFEIEAVKVAKPELAADSFTYDGTEKVAINPAEGDPYVLTGDLSATDAGSYTVTATLNDANHAWEDGTTEPVELAWQITPAEATFKFGSVAQQPYTGEAIEPTVVVTPTPADATYELTYVDNVEVGTARIVATATGNYTGTGEKTFKIVEPVAKIGDTYYTTLSAAISTAKGTTDQTIELLKDQNLSGILNRFTIAEGTEFTLDLGGHTLNMSGAYFTLKGGSLTVDNGTINVTGNMSQEFTVNSGELTIGADATINGTGKVSPVAVFGPATINVSGTLTAENSFALSGNGSAGKGGYTVNVNEGAVLTSASAPAIYHPNEGTVTISGGTVTGTTAVYQKSGELNITGGELHATGAKADFAHNGNGAIATGDALVVETCGYPGGDPVTSITGGTLVSDNASAVASYATEGHEPEAGFIAPDATAAFSDASDSTNVAVPEGKYLAQGEDGLYRLADYVRVDKPEPVEGLVYDGDAKTGVEAAEGYTLSGATATNAGTHTATATLAENHVWSDGTTDPYEVTWTIAKAKVETPAAVEGLIYNGTELTGVEPTDSYTLTGNTSINAGTYTATATLADANNYEWSDSAFDGKVEWTIAKAQVEIPTAIDDLVYNGTEQNGIALADAQAPIVLEGNAKTDADTYTATATLDSNNFAWSDGTTEPKSIKWTLARARIDDCNIVVSERVFAGEPITDAVDSITYADNYALKAGVDYQVTYLGNDKPGTGVAIFVGMGNFTGTTMKVFNITAGKVASIDEITETYAVTGEGIEPTVTVRDDKNNVIDPACYDLTFENNIGEGTATVTATGKNGYTGTASTTFTITAPDKTGLQKAIADATAAAALVDVSDEKGFDLEPGTKYTTSDEKQALLDAIQAAQDILDDTTATADVIAEAINSLNEVADEYEDAIKIAKAAVAEVNGEVFATLQEAVKAAEAGDTVTMIADEDLAAQVVVDRDVTIDLNGKTLSNTSDIWDTKTDSWSLISVRGGNVTITGEGTLRAKENDCYALDVRDGGTLTIEDGTYVGNIHAVYVHTGDAFIEGGDFSVQQKYNATTPDGFVINLLDANRDNGTATATITGGTFHGFDPSNNPAEGAGTDFTPVELTGDEVSEGVWTVKAKTEITVPTGMTLTYNGTAQTGVEAAEGYKLADDNVATDAGSYTATASLSDPHATFWRNAEGEATTDDLLVDWQIEKASLDDVTVEKRSDATVAEAPVAGITAIKIGETTIDPSNYDVYYIANDEVGTATAIIVGKNNLKGMRVETFEITPAVDFTELDAAYDAAEELQEEVKDATKLTGDEQPTAPGTYVSAKALDDLEQAKAEAEAVLDDPDATQDEVDAAAQKLNEAIEAVKETTVVIEPAQVEIPTAAEGLTYNAAEQTGVAEGEGYALTGDAKATNAGTYTATATLSDPENTTWTDGTTEPKAIEWTIAKADLSEADAHVVEGHEPVVKLDGNTLTSDDYDVVYTTDPDTHNSVALIVGKNNTTGAKKVDFSELDPSELEKTLDDAKKLAESLKTSEDGTNDTDGNPIADGDEYLTPEDAKALQDAIDEAAQALEDALKNPDATQKDIDDATQALKDAIEAAEEAKKVSGRISIADATLEVADQTYTGSGIDPQKVADAVKLTLKDGTVVDPADYNIAYKATGDGAKLSGNLPLEGGTYTATATGKNNYRDTVSTTFKVIDKWERISGAAALDTMSAIVNADAENGGFTPANTNTVVIASRNNWEDPLAATALAGLHDAPLLLVASPKYGLPKQTRAELAHLKPNYVIVVGTTTEIPNSTLTAIKSASGASTVTRIAGNSYVDRANNIFNSESGWGKTAIISTQNSFKDTLSAAPFAYKQKFPVLYVGPRKSGSEGGVLATSTINLLKRKGFKKVIIMGGPIAVSNRVHTQLKNAGISYERWFGQTALDTSAEIAIHAMDNYGMTIDHVSIARSDGENYVDALAGAALTGRLNSVLVLANSRWKVGSGTKAFDRIKDRIQGKLVHGHIYGGELAISKQYEQYFRKTQ